jgi:hypothetical protein
MHGHEMLEHVKSLMAGLAPYASEEGPDGQPRLVPRWKDDPAIVLAVLGFSTVLSQ